MSALWPKGPGSGFCVRRTANKKAPHDGEAWHSFMSHTTTATYTIYSAHLFIEKQARYEDFLQFSSHFRDC